MNCDVIDIVNCGDIVLVAQVLWAHGMYKSRTFQVTEKELVGCFEEEEEGATRSETVAPWGSKLYVKVCQARNTCYVQNTLQPLKCDTTAH